MLWTAWVKINGRLNVVEFESISTIFSDALTEAQGRYGTDDISLFPR